jgi:hypothetical protein
MYIIYSIQETTIPSIIHLEQKCGSYKEINKKMMIEQNFL